MLKHSVILSNVGSCCDRYMPEGYSYPYTIVEMFERLSTIHGVDGVELIGNSNISEENVFQVKEYLNRFEYEAVSIIPDHFGKRIWSKGAFTSSDEDIRKKSVEECCKMIDIAKILDCSLVSIWNGQDGYDYPLQADYDRCYEWLIQGIRQCARYSPDIKISLEYKPKEPRNHSFISNVYSALAIINDINEKNVGITIDTGHSLEAYENMAEAACAALRKGKLFHLHMNDNYRLWDDDMITGSIHTVEFIELFYWIKKYKYDGWMSTDQYPYREDSVKAVEQSIEWFKAYEKIVDSIDEKNIKQIFDSQDAIQSVALMRKLILGA